MINSNYFIICNNNYYYYYDNILLQITICMKKFLEYNDNYSYWFRYHDKKHCLFIFLYYFKDSVKITYDLWRIL